MCTDCELAAYGQRILSSSLCLSQGSSRRASARRRGSFQPKDLGWLDSCDKHRNEGEM
ncbi:integrase [Agrobacterium tumefaciens]|nr:integrase [Agrobacterium tumefaciens]